jgi:PAS domain S-box-containing protein
MKPKAKPMPKRSRPSRPPKAPGALRRAAEVRLKGRREAHPPKTKADLRRLQHDLEVHQVELEMQNKELRRAQVELETALEQYTELYDFAPVGYLTLKPDGTILRANLAAASLLGIERSRLSRRRFGVFVAAEARAAFAALLTRAFETKAPQVGEVQLSIEERPQLTVQLRAELSADVLECRVALSDITERKRLEEERGLTLHLLDRINSSPNLRALMQEVTLMLRDATGCEAVGIRLQDGEDFPYFQTEGYSPEFVRAENTLCAVDPRGEVVRDSQGHPVLECMCGDILCGRFDTAKPFFTARGSFWTNCTMELLTGTTEAAQQGRTRNRCNSEGYESVALIRLRSGGETFGLLQFNDKRRGRFTPARIAHLERIADHLAVALARWQAEEARRRSDKSLRLAAEAAGFGTYTYDFESGTGQWSSEFKALLGLKPDEALLLGPDHLVVDLHPEDRPAFLTAIAAANDPRGHGVLLIDYRILRPDGSVRWLQARGLTTFAGDGAARHPARAAGVVLDISERKRAEEALHHLSARLLELRDEERRHIARELHDSTVQDLAAVVVNLSFLRTAVRRPSPEARQALLDSLGLADRAATGLRTLTYLLHPPLLEELGLAGALRDFVDGFARRSGVRVDLELEPEWRRMPEEIELALFRVIQESIANIHRHSGSDSAGIILRQSAAEVRLEVRDAGHGFILKSSESGGLAPALGVGITGMRERLRELGGRLEVTSNSGGTIVRATLPRARPESGNPP